MKVSVITVCFNNEDTIEDTLRSISDQSHDNVEHIIVDGGSTDNTLAIIQRYSHVSKLISEPDKGIYDAMNKGIRLATGDVIGTLNADDFYASKEVLEIVKETFEKNQIDACYADLVYVKENDVNHIVRYWKSNAYKQGLFKTGWMPAHPTFYAKRDVFTRFGLFDLSYKIAADVELLFRLLEKNKIKTLYIPKVFVKMRLGGTTNKSFKNIYLQNREIVRTLQSAYPNFSLFKFIVCKLINRTKQFLSAIKRST